MTELVERLGEIADVDISVVEAPSYDRLAQLIHHGEIDLAWVPPIPLIALAQNQRVVPLVTNHRAGQEFFPCAIIVAAGSKIDSLAGLASKRAAWVDIHSAAGFVLPRIELAAKGVDLSTLRERFYGGHEAIVRAVASGRADFAGTFARKVRGTVTGAWSQMSGLAESIKVIATFGEIPPDAIAARFDMDLTLRETLTKSLLAMAKTEPELLRAAIGADDFKRPKRQLYEPFQALVMAAYGRGELATSATRDDAILRAAATIEQRPPEADATQEMPAIEIDDDEP